MFSDQVAKLDGAVGEWYLPSAPSARRPGALRRHEALGMWKLSVFGTLSSDQEGVPRETIFGDTTAGLLTLPSFQRPAWTETHPSKVTSERWEGTELLHGGHYADDQPWSTMYVPIPYAWDWFSPVFPDHEEQTTNPLERGLIEKLGCSLGSVDLHLVRYTAEQFSYKQKSTEAVGGYVFMSESGFTLAQQRPSVVALENLHLLLFGAEMRSSVMQLTPAGGQRDVRQTTLSVTGQDSLIPSLHPAYGWH